MSVMRSLGLDAAVDVVKADQALNMVERFFRDISEKRLRRGVFTSVPGLVSAIDEYVAHYNTNPKPFIWTKSARDTLQKVIHPNSRLSSKQNATRR